MWLGQRLVRGEEQVPHLCANSGDFQVITSAGGQGGMEEGVAGDRGRGAPWTPALSRS
ncbi:hypothetical protein ACFQZC_01220 [Streptacidiphilus monticola]